MPSRSTTAARVFVPPHVDADDPLLQGEGYHTPPDGVARRREAVSPLPRRTRQGTGPDNGAAAEAASTRATRRPGRQGPLPGPAPATGPAPSPSYPLGTADHDRARARAAVFVVWGLLGYLAFRGGVSSANKRLPRATRTALAPDKGSPLGNPTTILLLGTDHSLAVSRSGDRHSDSITLLRTDPAHNRLDYLSIPRDLRVEIPDYGPAKINTSFQVGGPRLAIRTVASYTDIPVNHVIVVNFADFRDLIDKVGGVDVVVTRPILSKFDCPYASPVRCSRWPGWHFRRARSTWTGGGR